MVIGPWCNQPEEYEGYNGFVGWAGVTRLRTGRWIASFNSGFWHWSFPSTPEILKEPACSEKFAAFERMGCQRIHAPSGGRAHIMSSDDAGLSWSRPATLVNTDMDDRHPSILELDDGTLLCTFFQAALPARFVPRFMLSHDQGRSWSQPQVLDERGGGFGNGPAIQLADNSVIWVLEGSFTPEVDHDTIGVFRSGDRGRSFELVSVIQADHPLHEASVAELPDGRLVLIAREHGDVCWSEDGGYTWTTPATFGVSLFDPHLVTLPNGVLACISGSYKTWGLRVILSPDGGRTWHGPAPGQGYEIDASVYGYSHPMLLDDGSIALIYQHTGGHRAHQARTQALWLVRLAVSPAADAVTILPAPGSPREMGLAEAYLKLVGMPGDGGDPKLGMLC